MSEILDALVAVNIVVDMIDSFRARGINIDMADVDAECAKRDAERTKVNADLGIKD